MGEGGRRLTAPAVRWLRQRRAARRLRQTGLWFHPDYAPSALCRTERAPCIVVERAEKVIAQLEAEGLLRLEAVRPARLATYRELARVHEPRYLQDSARAEVLARVFALPEEAIDVDAMLRGQRRAVGATVDAAREVAAGRLRVGFNLGGGFHHAGPESGAGFCVYNDVAVAIARLRHEGYADPIAVVDLDFHQGDGLLAAAESLSDTRVLSLHGSIWRHAPAPQSVQRLLPEGTGDEAYLEALRAALPAILDPRPGLVFYLAGNDVLAGDPLGGFALTEEGVLERDRLVARAAAEAEAGLVVTLGGGYRPDAWRCTANFLRWLLCGAVEHGTEPEAGLRARFARIAARLDPAALRDDQAWLTEDEVMADLGAGSPARLFDYYSMHGVEYGLERYGVLGYLRGLGFHDLEVTIDPSDRQRQLVRVHGRKPFRSGPLLLIELVAGRRHMPLPDTVDGPVDVLAVEWLLLQDPTSGFTLARPPLPGQRHPGLGIATEIQELLVQVCARLSLEAIVSRPAHFHNAAGALDFHFLSPEAEGRMLAWREVLAGCAPAEASSLVERGALTTADGAVARWEPDVTVLPLSERLKAYFASSAYAERRDAEAARWRARGLRVVPLARSA
jgi:acetoin utilization deacetylase AcuC-like enzyme